MKKRTSLPLILLCVAALLGASGCSTLKFPGVFKIDIAQGNIVTKEMVDKLKPGMTRRQVRYVMGSPLLTDTFHQNRWDYHYSILIGDQRLVKRHITLLFENDQYIETIGDVDALVVGTAPVDAIRKSREVALEEETATDEASTSMGSQSTENQDTRSNNTESDGTSTENMNTGNATTEEKTKEG